MLNASVIHCYAWAKHVTPPDSSSVTVLVAGGRKGFWSVLACLQSWGNLSDISFLAEGVLVVAAGGNASPTYLVIRQFGPSQFRYLDLLNLSRDAGSPRSQVIIALTESILSVGKGPYVSHSTLLCWVKTGFKIKQYKDFIYKKIERAIRDQIKTHLVKVVFGGLYFINKSNFCGCCCFDITLGLYISPNIIGK